MSTTRKSRPVAFAAMTIALVAGGLGITAALTPQPTDAAVAALTAGLRLDCATRLGEVEHGLGISMVNLSNAAGAEPAERCGVYRSHLASLEGASAVYGQCLSGFAREDQVGQLELAALNWRSVIAERCGR